MESVATFRHWIISRILSIQACWRCRHHANSPDRSLRFSSAGTTATNLLGCEPQDLAELEQILETLPIASDEYGIASNRLASVRRYLQAGETGAARYELRLLAGLIKQQSRQRQWHVSQEGV